MYLYIMTYSFFLTVVMTVFHAIHNNLSLELLNIESSINSPRTPHLTPCYHSTNPGQNLGCMLVYKHYTLYTVHTTSLLKFLLCPAQWPPSLWPLVQCSLQHPRTRQDQAVQCTHMYVEQQSTVARTSTYSPTLYYNEGPFDRQKKLEGMKVTIYYASNVFMLEMYSCQSWREYITNVICKVFLLLALYKQEILYRL